MAFWTVPATFRLRLQVETDQGTWKLDPKAFAPFDVVFGRALYSRFNPMSTEQIFMGLGEAGHPPTAAFVAGFIFPSCKVEPPPERLEFDDIAILSIARCGPRFGFTTQAVKDPETATKSMER